MILQLIYLDVIPKFSLLIFLLLCYMQQENSTLKTFHNNLTMSVLEYWRLVPRHTKVLSQVPIWFK